MGWHYAARRVGHPDGDYLEVVEVYNLEDGVTLTTENPVTPYGENKEELIRDLEMMASDVLHYDIIEGKDEE